ncbi:MAG: C2H2-type zinc finger protein [Dehalococcoidales bacterium]|nr:C2H2-type zinc finger protein [Dehalococcoidales bacterium]
MYTCKICGREFKTPQALGGHMKNAHPEYTDEVLHSGNGSGESQDIGEPIEASEEIQSDLALVPEETSQAEQIRTYLKQGYTVKQLTGQFGFKETTVRQEVAKIIQPEGDIIEEKPKEEMVWPIIRKMGGGAEVIAPEAVLRQYMGGTPQEELELKAIMKFRAAMLMVMDLVNVQKGTAEADAKRMEPILKLMKETREEQDAAAQRAKDSNAEIADRAAYETANQLNQVIAQNNARITDSINQIRQAIGNKEGNPLSELLNSMQSMQQLMGMFGVNMTGTQQNQASGETWQPPPITRRKRNQKEEGEG